MLAEPDGAAALPRVIRPVGERLDVAPSGIVLSALEQKLAADRARRAPTRLAAALETVAGAYDYALIDCPPNVGVLTFNALRASREVIVPLETSFFAIHGVQKLLETLALLAERIGHEIAVRILPTLYDGRTRYARETLGEIRDALRSLCFDTVIRSNVKLREAARAGRPIVRFARSANGAVDYAALAVELAATPPDSPPSCRRPPRARCARWSCASATPTRARCASRATSTAGSPTAASTRRWKARTAGAYGRRSCVFRPARTSTATSSTASGAPIRRTRASSRARSAEETLSSSCDRSYLPWLVSSPT